MIRVMSFNLRYGGADDGDNSWAHRKELVAERIRHFDPDLLGLQECVDGEQANFVKAQFADYNFFARQRGNADRPDAEMAPLLYKRSRFERIDRGYFWLGESPYLPGIASWDAHFARMVMWTQLRDRQEPDHVLTFLNTHFDYAPLAVAKSAKVLRDQLELLDFGTPLIITGDLNAEKDSLTYQTLVGNGNTTLGIVYDTLRAANGDRVDEGTFHDFGRRDRASAIDWILATDHFTTLEAGIDRHQQGELFPSDHYPIWAVVERNGW
jgi:endonuclease/exonuclease/phosphatase family metal-dependent hydrolase